MRSVQVVAHRDRIDAIFEAIRPAGLDPSMTSHMARYLCVLSSGFIEESVRLIVTDYANRKSNVEVARFVQSKLAGFINPKLNKIFELVAEFDPDMRVRLESDMPDEVRAAIDGVVDNRHRIAHGKDIGIGLPVIKNYWSNVVRGVELLEQLFA